MGDSSEHIVVENVGDLPGINLFEVEQSNVVDYAVVPNTSADVTGVSGGAVARVVPLSTQGPAITEKLKVLDEKLVEISEAAEDSGSAQQEELIRAARIVEAKKSALEFIHRHRHKR